MARGTSSTRERRPFLRLDFPAGSFDAVYAKNCLLHVPNHDLPAVLAVVGAILRPAATDSSR
jgi:hypothetical protein